MEIKCPLCGKKLRTIELKHPFYFARCEDEGCIPVYIAKVKTVLRSYC
jgi:hypothetical protein